MKSSLCTLSTRLGSVIDAPTMHVQTTTSKPSEVEQSSAACSVRHAKRQRLSQASDQPPADVLTESIHASDQDHTPLHMPIPLAMQQHASNKTHGHTARDPARDPLCARAAEDPAVTSQHEQVTAPVQGLATAKPICENKHFSDASHQKQPVGQHASAHAQADSPPETANTHSTSATATQFRGNVKRVKDAESFQRQKERRQKKAAFLLDGTTTGPVVGVAKGGSWGHAAQQHAVRMQSGQIVQVPVQPNRSALRCFAVLCFNSSLMFDITNVGGCDSGTASGHQQCLSTKQMWLVQGTVQNTITVCRSQVLLMQSITAALLQKRHALLESPTGTGQMPLLFALGLALTLAFALTVVHCCQLHFFTQFGMYWHIKLSLVLHPSSHLIMLDQYQVECPLGCIMI